MADKIKYRTVSLPTGITDEVEHLIEELGYWPSVSAFVREATLEKIKEEQRRLLELRARKRRKTTAEVTVPCREAKRAK